MRTITAEAARALDREAVESCGIASIVLMENAATGAAAVAERMLEQDPGTAVVLIGPGNNGGDGLAVARKLVNRGRDARCVLCCPKGKIKGDAAINLRIAGSACVAIEQHEPDPAVFEGVALVIDAMLGTGSTPPLRGSIAKWAGLIGSIDRPVLALDLPTGLDSADGPPESGPCVQATETVTFVAPKPGMVTEAGAALCGRVTVADIGVPRWLIEKHTTGA